MAKSWPSVAGRVYETLGAPVRQRGTRVRRSPVTCAPVRAGARSVRACARSGDLGETGAMDERRRTLGAHIARLRRGHGLTQDALARLMDVTRTIVSAWENDRRRPRRDKLAALEQALDAPGEFASWRTGDESDDAARSVLLVPVPVSEVLRQAADGLVEHLSEDVAIDGKPGYGWRRELDDTDSPVSAMATAYGLKAVLLADAGGRPVDLPRLRKQLRRLELPDGGWSALERSPLARPEVTAAVLGALRDAGESEDYVAARLDVVVETLDRRVHGAERARPYVLSTSLLELSRLPLDDATARRFIDDLVDLSTVEQGARSWPVVVRDSKLGSPAPSTVHTADAVSALAAWRRRLGDPSLAGVVAGGRAWLERHGNLALDSEVIRSERADGGTELLPVHHFTPALALRGLVEAGSHAESSVVTRALRDTLAEYRPEAGLWRWPQAGGTYPVWMTYHALVALRAWALAQLVE
jgi:transcriptional regulator with XRE-family HTH domain